MVLLVLAGLILLVIVFFVVRKLGCCEKREPRVLLRFNIKWRKDSYEESKCEVCHTYGPMMLTPCKHFFHISCFQEATKEMVCPICGEPITHRIKIYCFMCRERSFKVKLCRVEELDDVMAEAKALHSDQCPR